MGQVASFVVRESLTGSAMARLNSHVSEMSAR